MTRDELKKRKELRLRKLNQELQRIKESLIALGAQKVILFGSLARGQGGLMSDADLVVILPSEMPFLERLRNLYLTLLPGSIDIFPYTAEEFSEMKDTNPFMKQVLKEGKVLYEKEP